MLYIIIIHTVYSNKHRDAFSTLFHAQYSVSIVNLVYLLLLQRWARVYRQTSFHTAVDTNNGIEAQNKVLQNSYLPHGRNISLSCLVESQFSS